MDFRGSLNTYNVRTVDYSYGHLTLKETRNEKLLFNERWTAFLGAEEFIFAVR